MQLKLVADVGNINSALTGVQAKTSAVGKAFGTLTSFAGPVAINAAITGIAMLTDALKGGSEDARKFADASSGLAGTLAPLGIAAGEAQKLADSAAAAGAALGFADGDVVVRGLQAFAEQTQSATEAQELLAAAMDLSRLQGTDLEASVATVQSLYKGSGRALAEFGVAGLEGMDAVNAALGDNATAAETWATTTEGQYAVAAAALDDGFEIAGTAINDATDNVILPAISKLMPIIGDLWAEWQPKLEEVAVAFGGWMDRLIEIWNKLQPAISIAIGIITPVLETLQTIAVTVFGAITGLLDTIIALLNGDFTGAWNAITGVVDTVVTGVQEAIGRMLGFLSDIVGTVLQVAGQIGGAIFDGIMGVVRGLADAIIVPFRDGLNTIIRALNSFQVPGFALPNPLYGIFGDPFGTPSINFWDAFNPINLPQLAKGGIVSKPTLALIGEAGPEAVVPLGHGGMGGPTIVINVGVGDPAAIGAAVTKVLRAYRNAGGGPAIKAAVG